jgi:hypothetical protein
MSRNRWKLVFIEKCQQTCSPDQGPNLQASHLIVDHYAVGSVPVVHSVCCRSAEALKNPLEGAQIWPPLVQEDPGIADRSEPRDEQSEIVLFDGPSCKSKVIKNSVLFGDTVSWRQGWSQIVSGSKNLVTCWNKCFYAAGRVRLLSKLFLATTESTASCQSMMLLLLLLSTLFLATAVSSSQLMLPLLSKNVWWLT